jgi:hypothetical protein
MRAVSNAGVIERSATSRTASSLTPGRRRRRLAGPHRREQRVEQLAAMSVVSAKSGFTR